MDTSKASDNAKTVLHGVTIPAASLTADDYVLIIDSALERYGRLVKYFPCVIDHNKALIGINDFAGGLCDSPGAKPDNITYQEEGLGPTTRLLPMATVSSEPRPVPHGSWQDHMAEETFLFLTDSFEWVILTRSGELQNIWRDNIVFVSKRFAFRRLFRREFTDLVGDNHQLWCRILASLQYLAKKGIDEREKHLSNIKRAYADVNEVLSRIQREK